jgi:hypothetical protein
MKLRSEGDECRRVGGRLRPDCHGGRIDRRQVASRRQGRHQTMPSVARISVSWCSRSAAAPRSGQRAHGRGAVGCRPKLALDVGQMPSSRITLAK